MLGKVLKYDMRSMNKWMLPAYLILLILAGLVKVMGLLTEKVAFLQVIFGLLAAAFVFSLIGIFFYALVASIVRFYKNFMKEEGYLTHSLPVKKGTLLLSKLISSNVHFILTTIVVILAVIIVLAPNLSVFTLIWNELSAGITAIGLNPVGMMIYIVFLLFISNLSNILLFYLALCLGQTRNDKKLVYSVVYGIILYTIVQIIGTIFILLLGLFNPEFYTITNADVPSTTFIMQIFGYSGVLSVALCAIYYVLSYKILDKKLNLE